MDLLEELNIHLPKEILESNKQEGRCSGHCCVGFTFPVSIKDIKDLLEWRNQNKDWKEQIKDTYHEKYSRYNKYSNEYFYQLLDMFEEQDRTLQGGINPANPNSNDSLKDKTKYPGFFSCKHFNKQNGNCMNYENRPDFCRTYPTRGDCLYKGCTMKCKDQIIVEVGFAQPKDIV